MLKTIRFCMAGFGNVGAKFIELLVEKESELLRDYNCRLLLTGVSTRTKGTLMSAEGLSLQRVLAMNKELGRFDSGDAAFKKSSTAEMIATARAELFIELTSLSIRDGEPATSFIRSALSRGLDVITANKGPEAFHYRELSQLAARNGRRYLYETIVMDGTPVFNLVQKTLLGNRLLSVRGILNGTTNFILGKLENGVSYESAVKEAQRIQLAEADPSMDVDGWDGAAKICAIANILMGADLTPKDVELKSLAAVSSADVKNAKNGNQRIKYICCAFRDETNGSISAKVTPELIGMEDPFFNVSGTSAAITLCTDMAGEISIVQANPGILQTAYGVYSDLLSLISERYGR